ncbi:MAG: type VI secretion system protein TssL, long form [Betaproteobacteria bacterium]
MSERPKDGVDPDATVMIPAPRPDDDATVMMPAPRPDDDATVMMPAPRADDDATVMMPAPRADDDATVMMPSSPVPESAEPDPDATIAIPTPGRRRDTAPVELPSAPPAGREASAADLGSLGGLNPLVAAANPVLVVVPQIRHALRHPDPEGLRAGLRERLNVFEQDARATGIGAETLADASFALCALLDESAASTPWGTAWSTAGMLAERHPGSNGGERFFELLEKLSADPASNIVVLEFFHVCLALGFEGRYRDAANGRDELVAQRARLLEQIRQQRAPHDGELSGHWRGVAAPARRAAGGLALWAAASGAALLLTMLYVAYSFSLGSLSDPVARELAQLKAPVPAAAAPGLATPRIHEQLTAEIARGEVAVTDSAGLSTIVIRGDHLFASGSARLEAGVAPVIVRIGEALERVPGSILVTGHTDDVPIRTARFPSNWELSTERAASVVKLLAGKLADPARLRAEGLADSAPVVPNDSAANRARNRRVTIILRSVP